MHFGGYGFSVFPISSTPYMVFVRNKKDINISLYKDTTHKVDLYKDTINKVNLKVKKFEEYIIHRVDLYKDTNINVNLTVLKMEDGIVRFDVDLN